MRRSTPGEPHRFFELPPSLWEAPHAAAQTFLVVREAVRRVLFEETLTMHAAAIAFYGLLSFGPVILVILSLAGMIYSGDTDLASALREQLSLVFPAARHDVLEQVMAVGAKSRVYGLLGLITLLWSGSRIFASLDTSLNIIWRVKKTRPYWQQRLLSIGLVPLVLILFMGLLSATSLQNLMESAALDPTQSARALPLLSDFMRHVAPPLLSWAVLFALYWLMPARKVLVRAALVGSAVSALLWQAARLAFDVYLRNFDRMDAVYGTATGLVIFMLWIYYSALTLLVGAVVGASDLDRRLSQSARRTVKKSRGKSD